jgi:hypothetical protein
MSEAQGTPAAEVVATNVPEEYASVTISIDHLLADAETPHTVVKCVFSTESASESLLAQIDYFEQAWYLRNPATIDMISEGNKKATAFVYEVGEQLTNVIVDMALFNEVMANHEMSHGTMLGAHASFIGMAADLKRAARDAGKPDKILAFVSQD